MLDSCQLSVALKLWYTVIYQYLITLSQGYCFSKSFLLPPSFSYSFFFFFQRLKVILPPHFYSHYNDSAREVRLRHNKHQIIQVDVLFEYGFEPVLF